MTFHGVLEITAGMGIERPKEPFSGALGILEKAFADVLKPPPAAPATNPGKCNWRDMLGVTSKSAACYRSLIDSISDWIAYLGELASWLVERVAELVDFLLTALLMLPVKVLLALLYAIQLMLYNVYRSAHWTLALHGFVAPLRDELENSVARRLIHAEWSCLTPHLRAGKAVDVRRVAPYPKLTRLGDSHLSCPVRGFEAERRLWNFVTSAAALDPGQFIEAVPFSEDNLRRYANASTPRDCHSLQSQGRSIGNAIGLTAWMISTAHDAAAPASRRDICFANWNLDSDRGYGYKTWSGTVEPASVVEDDRFLY